LRQTFPSPADYISLVMRLRNNHIREGATSQRDTGQEDKLCQPIQAQFGQILFTAFFLYDLLIFLI